MQPELDPLYPEVFTNAVGTALGYMRRRGVAISATEAAHVNLSFVRFFRREFQDGDRVAIAVTAKDLHPLTARQARECKPDGAPQVRSIELDGTLRRVADGWELIPDYDGPAVALTAEPWEHVLASLPPLDAAELDAWFEREHAESRAAVTRTLAPTPYADGTLAVAAAARLAEQAWLLALVAPWVNDLVIEFPDLPVSKRKYKDGLGAWELLAAEVWDQGDTIGENIARLRARIALGALIEDDVEDDEDEIWGDAGSEDWPLPDPNTPAVP